MGLRLAILRSVKFVGRAFGRKKPVERVTARTNVQGQPDRVTDRVTGKVIGGRPDRVTDRETGKVTGRGPAKPTYPPYVWLRVRSSWIKALRFVPTGVGAKQHPVGYIDLWVAYQDRKYRYGPGLYVDQFVDWVSASSRGKYWWYKLTRAWSPAARL